MKSSKMHAWIVLAISLVVSFVATAARADQDITFNATITGGTAPVTVTVPENPKALPSGATILAVHGFTETGKSWGSVRTS